MSDKVVREGSLSFPSGHSSTAFAAMVPLTVFFMHHLRPWANGCIVRLVICVLPLYIAFFVAVSRTRDNRHHFSDIIAGSVIGVFAACGGFLINLKYSTERGHYELRVHQDLIAMAMEKGARGGSRTTSLESRRGPQEEHAREGEGLASNRRASDDL